ncbi:MAG: aldose 1-epimerase [Clostridia bacterium]|nr:aldose 1-epimerase [Clostridia bacterium]
MKTVSIIGGGYTAVINADRGANCISLRNDRYRASLLREPDYGDEKANPYLYGMPILFPVNRISGGKFDFEGRTYVFPINEPSTDCALHGELHRAPFSVIEQTENSVTLRYTATESSPYLSFPHSFSVTIRYSLSEGGLTHSTALTNHSKLNMPYFLGFHTTFNLPFSELSEKRDLRARVGLSLEYERNMKNYLPTGVCPSPDRVTEQLSSGKFVPCGEHISRHYKADASGIMSITDVKNGISLIYESCAELGYRLIYNGDGTEYICMEPQTCIANCQNSPFPREEVGFSYLAPGETKVFYSRIFIERM